MARVLHARALLIAVTSAMLAPAATARTPRSAAIDAMIAITETASKNFEEGSFDKLEAQAKTYRDQSYRLPNGDYALTVFYGSMNWYSARGEEKKSSTGHNREMDAALSAFADALHRSRYPADQRIIRRKPAGCHQ